MVNLVCRLVFENKFILSYLNLFINLYIILTTSFFKFCLASEKSTPEGLSLVCLVYNDICKFLREF